MAENEFTAVGPSDPQPAPNNPSNPSNPENPSPNEAPGMVVPPGFVLAFTPKGIPYLKKETNTEEDDEAANEFKVSHLPITVSLDEIERRFGIGTRLYFNFLKFIMITNAVLTVIAFIQYVNFLAHRPSNTWKIQYLFVSSYQDEHGEYGLWMAMNIIGVIAWFVFPVCYYLYVKKRLEKNAIRDHDNPYSFSGMGVDEIAANRHFTSSQRFWRRVGVYSICAVLAVISGLIVFGLQYSIKGYAGKPTKTSLAVSFAVSISVAFVNQVFNIACGPLTTMEKHKTYSLYRKHHGFKLITFKMINVTCMYIALSLAYTSKDKCVFEDSGTKFLTLMLTDLFLMNAVEYFVPLLRLYLTSHVKKLSGKGSDDEAKPEFDVAQEYLELFYRQFVIYLGMSVFPMVTALGLLTNIVEYPLDKYRMLRICQKPKPLDLSMKRFLIFWLTIVACAAIVSYPQGAGWVLSRHRSTNPDLFGCCAMLPGKSDLPSGFDFTACARNL